MSTQYSFTNNSIGRKYTNPSSDDICTNDKNVRMLQTTLVNNDLYLIMQYNYRFCSTKRHESSDTANEYENPEL